MATATATAMGIGPVAESNADRLRSRAVKAAADFEAVLLNQVLGELERSFAQLPGSKVEHTTEAYSGMGMQALASGLARAGGVGLSSMITHSLLKTEVRTKVSQLEKQDY
jgi:Rod binding domain-containing protein